MIRSHSEETKNPARRAWPLGVRARLLLAFVAITAFAVLAAAAGMTAFRLVGSRLEVVDTRLPPTLSALELARSAERIIAAAPALLATPDRERRDEVEAALAAEVERLEAELASLQTGAADLKPLADIEAAVAALTANLATLEDIVARRLDTNARISTLRSRVFDANEETQRLLAPWLEVTARRIAALVEARAAGPGSPAEAPGRLSALIELQELMRGIQAEVSTVTDMLAEASTTGEPQRLPILAFQLGLALRELEAAAAGLDPNLRPLFLDEVAKLRQLTQGADAITDARAQELALIGEGERLLAEAGRLSAQLSDAVDRLGSAAKRDIGAAIGDALSVQRLSARMMVAVVALSLLTSILIVWLYVGRNIVRRLTALGDGMLAIAGGRLQTPVPAEGTDEIAAMASAVEVFRRNAIELERLLEEREQTAARLEQMVAERTHELSQSLEQQQAAGEILRVIASSPNDVQPVFEITAKSVAQLLNVQFCQLFRFDGELVHFAAQHGLSPEAVDDIRRAYPMPPGRASAVARAIFNCSVEQIADVHADREYGRGRFATIMNFRSVVAVPMLKDGRPIGAIAMARSTTGAFPERQIELLRSFADQAVIAIENVRLFKEIEDKTRQLEIANRYTSHFLASASHDLRQPLHALNLFVTQLRTESAPEERDRLVARINAAISSMNELFEALLDMSKLDAGVLEVNVSEFPIAPLLARMEATFAEAARERGLRLTVVPSSAWVRSDFVLLERILLNLVSNAVRYTARGGVVVGCRRRGGELRIDVCDSGAGIPPEQQREIFGEFVQLAAPQPDRRGGLGLGLSIVERLGRLLDHRVELSSRTGRGSRFSVTVPQAAARSEAAEAPAGRFADPARGKLIVVIDDDTLVLDGMGGILRSWGCDVVTAERGEAALAKLAEQQRAPDLVISDYRLADGKTGIEAIEHLRAALGAAIPAFLISGDTAPARLREANARGYRLLHKPVAPMRLRAMLNQLITAREAKAAGPAARARPIRRPAAAAAPAHRPR